jgi:hypothetical protein
MQSEEVWEKKEGRATYVLLEVVLVFDGEGVTREGKK